MLFDVRLVAFDDAVVADPAAALVRVFGLDHHAASELLRRLPHVVKRGVSEEGARKLVNALERIGAHTEIVVSSKKAAGHAAAVSQSTASRADTTHGAASRADAAARLGALPAPAAAARALIDARAAREAALARAALQQHSGQPVARMSSLGARPAAALVHDPDEDSLEADIGTQNRAVTPVTERGTLAVERPTIPTERSSVLVAERAAVAAERASLASVPRGPSAARPSAVTAQTQAARAHVPQASAPSPVQAATPAMAPVQQAFRVSLPQPVTASLATAPQITSPLAVSLPQMPPANLQRPAKPAGAVSVASVQAARQRPALATLSIHGPPVEASVCTQPGTKTAVFVAWLVAILLSVTLTVLSAGLLTVVSVVALAVAFLSRRRALASMRASALPVGQSQLPEVYACLRQFSTRLGLATVPRFYIVRDGKRGLRTTTDGRELVFMIDEDTLLHFIEGSEPRALSFLIAHELCRHVLGHTKWARRMLSRVSPRLACLDLVSADSAATALVSDHGIVKAALLALLGASRLHAYIDHDELDRVATSTTREPAFWPTRFGAEDAFVLARLYHLQRGYV